MKSERIDLVLLDLWMPGLDGTALLEEMKRDPALREIPVIIISGQYADLTATECALHVSLARAAPASTTETLNYLQALVAALPLRGLPAPAGAQA